MTFNHPLWRDEAQDAESADAARFIRQQTHPVIFIRCWNPAPIPRVKLLAHFDTGIEENETYTIYRIEPRRR